MIKINLRKFKEGIKKHKMITASCLVVCLCIGIYIGMGGGLLNTGNTVNSDIPQHDGDVLVDSINVNDDSGTGEITEEEESQENTQIVTSDEAAESGNSDKDFEEMRATIEMDRNQVISMLTDTIAQSESPQEKESAQQEKLSIINNMKKEQNIENMIKTKGLPECLVLITDNGVNVTVAKKDLTQSEVAKICDIIMRETGKKASEIVIQSKK